MLTVGFLGVPVAVPALSHLVVYVVLVGAQPEVIRIYTGWIITGVQNT